MSKNFDINKFYRETDTDLIPTNTQVPEGFYVCLSCGVSIPIINDGDKLPVCKECQSITYWMKI